MPISKTAKPSRAVESKLVKDSDTDAIFAEARDMAADFRFDNKTAAVFDDMVTRSVPFHGEIQRMVTELAADFAQPGTNLYDLGCATGTSFVLLDNSDEMLGKARKKLNALDSGRPFELINADLHSQFTIENASVVLLVLTLQFVRPLYRDKLIRRVVDALLPGARTDPG